MQTFSELQATELKLVITVALAPRIGDHAPDVSVRVNGESWHAVMIEPETLTWMVDLASDIDIQIALQNKRPSEGADTAVVIQSITVDGFEFIPNFSGMAVYDNDHDWDHPTNYLGFNGVWHLKIPGPFYQRRHQITGQGWLLHPRG